ncbi:MAG: TMEM14 family protein [Nostoc sp.]|uniref:TMEM14 family protein n=1 Tax=Nostoc sp. TaxID=1180 RepID=UPI002FFC4527
MNLSIIAAFAYGILAIAGGIIGYTQARSRVSLLSGSISGLLLILAAYLQPAFLTSFKRRSGRGAQERRSRGERNTQAEALLLQGIAKLNLLRINEMLYLAQNLVNHPVRLGSITAPE